MPGSKHIQKLKTNKGVRDRFKVTKDGRFLYKPAGQDHFRAKKSGKRIRAKRHFVELSKSNVKKLRRMLPYL